MATLNVKNFPDSVYGRLKEMADQENRSVSQQVVHLLSKAVEHPSSPHSILELAGLGKDLWERIDASRHVDDERSSWD